MTVKGDTLIKRNRMRFSPTEKPGDTRSTRYLVLTHWPCGVRMGKVALSEAEM